MKKSSNSNNIKTFCLSDIGRVRKHNEDSSGIIYGANFIIMAVFDGMGGHKKGEVASKLALDTLKKDFGNINEPKLSITKAKKLLKQCLLDANAAIYTKSSTVKMCEGMGTTAVVAMILENDTIIANIGDSRAYILKPKRKRIKMLTTDQSYVEMLYETGQISKSKMSTHPYKNILTNALGITDKMHCDIKIYKNDYKNLLLCSDGLTNMVPEAQISMILNRDMPVENKCLSLINRAIDW